MAADKDEGRAFEQVAAFARMAGWSLHRAIDEFVLTGPRGRRVVRDDLSACARFLAVEYAVDE